MNTMRKFLASALLLTAFACTGSKGGDPPQPPAPAARLIYTDPTDPAQWRLIRNATSSTTHLVLDLMAPTNPPASGRGVTLVLTCDSKVAWKTVDGSTFTKNLAYHGDLVQRASVQGSDLRVLLSQKPGTVQAYGSTPVLSVAVDLVTGTLPGTVAFSAAQGAHLGSTAIPDSISVAVGSLKAE